jgi:hypothetical protein
MVGNVDPDIERRCEPWSSTAFRPTKVPTTRSTNAYTSSGRWTSAFTYVARPPAGWLSRAASTREATPVPGGEGEKDAETAVTIGQEGHAALFQTETDCVALKQSEP